MPPGTDLRGAEQYQPRPAAGGSSDQTAMHVAMTGSGERGTAHHDGRGEQDQQRQDPVVRVRSAETEQSER